MATPALKRAVPAMREVFRHGMLHQPCPAAEVEQLIISRRATAATSSLLESPRSARYKDYYKPRTGASVPTHTATDASVIGGSSNSSSNIVKNPSVLSSSPSAHTTSGDGSPSMLQPALVSNPAGVYRNMTSDSMEAELMPIDNYSVEEEIERRNRRLTVLFTWLGAKERYAHKYIDLWRQRGHTVLHVTCSVRDLLMPKTGAEVTAERVKEHMAALDGWRVLVHGISVGGFITQHVLRGGEPSVTDKLSHQIYDSFTNVEGLPEGVENAVPSRFSGFAKKIGQMYMNYADMSSFDASRDYILKGNHQSPIFFMHSMADRVAQYEVTKPLITAFQKKTPVDLFLMPKEERVPHVALLRHMGPPSYMDAIETFLHHNKDPVL